MQENKQEKSPIKQKISLFLAKKEYRHMNSIKRLV